jgi:hypothetical protein
MGRKNNMNTASKQFNWSIVIFLLVMWGLLTIRIGVPWFGHHDANGVFYMTMARNYELYGASELGFLQLHNYEIPALPENYNFYLHHPPMITWVLALVGVPMSLTEATSRWAMVCATMISIASLYVLARRLLGQKRALLVVMLYGLTPMIAYFGRMPNHEPLAIGFLMPFFTIYAQYLRYPTRARWVALAILAIFSMWTAWAAFFFFMALLFFGVIYRVETRLKKIITNWQKLLDLFGLGVVVVLATLAVPLFYESQHPGAIQRLLDVMVFRTSNIGGTRGTPEFTILEYIARQLLHMTIMMSLFVVVMGFLGIKPLLRQSRLTRTMTWAMLGGGAGFLLFFRNASYIHDYYKYYLMPAFSILACLGVVQIWGIRRSRWAKPAVLGLLVGSSIYAVIIFVGSHLSSNQSFPMDIARAINAHTTTQERILTNLTHQSPAIEFYAERNIFYENTPQMALEQAENATQPMVYVFCLNPLPESLQALPQVVVVDGDCYIIQLNGGQDEKAS